MDLSDGLDVRRVSDERHGSGSSNHGRWHGRLQRRTGRQGETRIAVTHLISKHPTEEAGRRRRARIESR